MQGEEAERGEVREGPGQVALAAAVVVRLGDWGVSGVGRGGGRGGRGEVGGVAVVGVGRVVRRLQGEESDKGRRVSAIVE